MLSKIDILNEIGKGICVFPLDVSNIKENSLNLCAGEFAWATSTKDIYYDDNENDKNFKFSLSQDAKHNEKLVIEKGKSAIVSNKGKQYILLLPNATTLIETQEVLSVGNYIGGTYHSKVGLASKGLGHIGTMVGPNFSGDSLIAIHNISDSLVVLNVGDSFVSVVFHYLNTPNVLANPTISGHTDKFAELGLTVSEEESRVLNADWKKQYEEVRKKLCNSNTYKELQNELRQKQREVLRAYFSKKNILISICAIIFFVVIYYISAYVDAQSGQPVWTDRFFNVGFSGIFIVAINWIMKLLKNNSKK